MIKQYRKKPVIVRALQYRPEEEGHRVSDLIEFGCVIEVVSSKEVAIWCAPQKRNISCVSDNWVVETKPREFYSYSPEYFEEAFEEVK